MRWHSLKSEAETSRLGTASDILMPVAEGKVQRPVLRPRVADACGALPVSKLRGRGAWAGHAGVLAWLGALALRSPGHFIAPRASHQLRPVDLVLHQLMPAAAAKPGS